MEKLHEKTPAILEKYYSKLLGSNTAIIVLKALAGATCAMAQIFDRSSPLGIAIAAADTSAPIYTAVGAAVGYIIAGREQSVYFAVACIIIGFINKIVYQNIDIKQNLISMLTLILPPVLSVAGAFTVLVMPYIYSNPMMYDVVLWCATLTLAAAFSVFARAVITQLSKGTLTGSSALSLSALYCVCIMGLSAVEGFGLSLGRIFGTVTILISAGNAGIAISTLLGTLTGLSLGLSGTEVTMAVTVYTCYGIFSAISAPLGRLAAALAGCGVLAFFDAVPNSQMGSLSLEGILAAAIFLAVPAGRIRSIIHINRAVPPHSLSLIAELKLQKAADGLRELTSISHDISHRLTSFESEHADTIYDKIASNICRTCPLALNCWQTGFDNTVDCFNHAMSTLKLKGRLSVEDLPKKFSYCTQKDEVCSMMEQLYKRVNSGKLQTVINTRTRGLLNAQIDNLGSILAELSYSISEIELISSENLELEDVFLSQGLELIALDELMISGVHTIIAQVASYRDGRYSLSALAEAVGEVMCKLFLPASAQQVGSIHIVTLKEAPKIHLTYSAHQTPSEDICGDSYTIFTTENERMYIILSDGMGTGKTAALDSTFTVSLLRRLISAGLSINTAVELVNAELIVRKGSEATTTVDIAEIHLHSPTVKLFKGGANRSLIYRGGRIICVDSQSLPVGILEKTFLDTDIQTLAPDDLLIMFSDGVGLADNSWVGAVIEQSRGESEATLASRLAKTAQLRLADDRPDDITVICARVHSFSA